MTDLAALTAHYVSIPSVSGNERALADDIEATLRRAAHLSVRRIGDNVVAMTTGARPVRVVVAGHLDTVPGDQGLVRADAEAVEGLGACDMKGSLAVMVDLATSLGSELAHEATWIFYANEEVDRVHSGLREIERAEPSLLLGDVAVVCEPTAVVVEAGCQGSIRVQLTLRGERAHTARPWRGRNAIHRLADVLAAIAAYEPRQVTIDDVTYVEQRQVVHVGGGVAGNVVPDAATIVVNERVAPDRTAAYAAVQLCAVLEALSEPEDSVEVLDLAEPAPPRLDHPLLARLVAASGRAPRAKLGYTDVAAFWALGMPATNFGAGDPELAHHAGELVAVAELAACRDVLASVLVDAGERA